MPFVAPANNHTTLSTELNHHAETVSSIKNTWDSYQRWMSLSDEELCGYINCVSALKSSLSRKDIETPSIEHIVVTLIYMDKAPEISSVLEASEFLKKNEDKLDFLSWENDRLTFCIDGGGSKTLLEVVDSQGHVILFDKRGDVVHSNASGPSNINLVRKEGVETALNDLFQDLQIGGKCIRDLLPNSRVIAGMAGVGISENLEVITALFEEQGVDRNNLVLLTDAELALRLLKGTGIILISGTGSICFAEKEGARYRVGGLGRILGDEGSGYEIGRQALAAVIAEEFNFGSATSLTPRLKEFFQVAEVKSLLPKINSSEMSAGTIALIAPLVFEEAIKSENPDKVSLEIVHRAAEALRKLVSTALKVSQLAQCELHVWGGVFKGSHSDLIVRELEQETSPHNITIVNQSGENAGVTFAKTFKENEL